MVVLLLILASFFAVLIPQLSSSISTLAANMGSYLESASSYMEGLSKQYPQYAGVFGAMGTSFTDFLSSLGTSATSIVTKLVTYSISMVTGLFSFLIGLIVAIYMLLDQEKFKRQAVKMFYALLPRPRAEYWFSVGRLTSHMFNRFIFGKALDSFIIGIACWICCAIMRIPYSPLIAFIVGLTNMIPVFGPFIGAIPCILILLFINPVSAVEFAVFILILQQIDGNILGPYILGDSMGLPTLWVMFAIILGGSMFGVLGMLNVRPDLVDGALDALQQIRLYGIGHLELFRPGGFRRGILRRCCVLRFFHISAAPLSECYSPKWNTSATMTPSTMADTYFVGTIGTSASGATGIVFGLMAILQAFGFMFGHVP